MNDDYKIDYEIFSIEEVIKIINFFTLIEKSKSRNIDKVYLTDAYKEYRSILNNKSLEKQYDKMLSQKSGVSIYKTMNDL